MTSRCELFKETESIKNHADTIESQIEDFMSERRDLVKELITDIQNGKNDMDEIIRDLTYIMDSMSY